MKRILLPLLAVLALPTAVEACLFGNCGSEYEARKACSNWKNKGKTKIVREPKPKQIKPSTSDYSFQGEDKYGFGKRADLDGDLNDLQYGPLCPKSGCKEAEIEYFPDREVNIRWCKYEGSTRQIMGMEEGNVKKRFKY